MLIFKALHLITMVCWFAGLFYMFRLFVYHAKNQTNKSNTNLLKQMAFKLFYYITTPSMVLTLLFGMLLLMHIPVYLHVPWFHVKMLFILILLVYHYFVGYTLHKFMKDEIFLSAKQCRIINEIPTVLLIIIIGLAVLKPNIP